jgi:chromate transport protein ChrA
MEIYDLLCVLAHGLAGALTAILCFVNPVSAVLAFLIFLIYEIDEDWHKRDEAYRDFLIYGLGFFITSALKIII